MAKLNFLKDYVSHNPSEIILMLIWCSSNIFFLFLSIFKRVVLLHFFVETIIHFFQDCMHV